LYHPEVLGYFSSKKNEYIIIDDQFIISRVSKDVNMKLYIKDCFWLFDPEFQNDLSIEN
jgi:hypothetical protein